MVTRATRVWNATWREFTVGDLVLATILTTIAVASAATGNPSEGPPLVTVPCAAVMGGSLAWRRRAPLASVVALLAADLTQAYLASAPGALWSLAILLVAAYSVGQVSDDVRSSLGIAALIGALWLQEFHEGGSDYLFVVLVLGGAWVVGRTVGRWTTRAHIAEDQSQEAAQAAIATERLRIARELHDIVAHSLSVISIQANAAEAALAHDPPRAVEPIRLIKASAHQSMVEMRRLLVLLRAESDDVAEPMPGLAQLDDLVESMRRAGNLPITVLRRGTPRDLPPGLDLTAYRIVQEALTNVVRHAGSAITTVQVSFVPDGVRLAIRNAAGRPPNPGQSREPGHGLIGLRERALLMGGTLTAGPELDGGFEVRAELPDRTAS